MTVQRGEIYFVNLNHYDRGHVYIRFVGTHHAYDGIDAETI